MTGVFYRSIIHDVAEIAGLTSFTFGEEDLDRHIQVGLRLSDFTHPVRNLQMDSDPGVSLKNTDSARAAN